MKQRQTKKIALGGIISALSLISMFLTGIFPFAEYTLPAIAGILLVSLVIEFSQKTAYMAYGAVGLLSLIISPSKEAAVLFLFFFGYYPILKSSIEQIKSIMLEWIVKFLVFNIAICTEYYVAIHLFGLVELISELDMGIKYGVFVLLILGNVAFFLYDKCISSLIFMYTTKIRPKIKFLY